MSDNLFSPGPRPSASIEKPTLHNFSGGGGYLNNWCIHCGEDDYPTASVTTQFCEDAEWAKKEYAFLEYEKKLKRERRHAATEEAIAAARLVLTAEQWDLLGITVAPYRDRDRIII